MAYIESSHTGISSSGKHYIILKLVLPFVYPESNPDQEEKYEFYLLIAPNGVTVYYSKKEVFKKAETI